MMRKIFPTSIEKEREEKGGKMLEPAENMLYCNLRSRNIMLRFYDIYRLGVDT